MSVEEKARLQRLENTKEELRKKGDKNRTPREEKTFKDLKKATNEIKKP